MSIYAIGDVQGCYPALQELLTKINFKSECDQLWFTGDLVNRGSQSLEVLRFVKGLGDSAICVLGNHDLHLLALATGAIKSKTLDTLDDVLHAADRDELLAWLRMRPLMHHDKKLDCALIHAGLLPQWNLIAALRLANEVQTALQHPDHVDFFYHLYGDQPNHWDENLRGYERLRVIVNAFTRLRYCDAEGKMDLSQKGPPGSQPRNLLPWFQVPARRNQNLRIIFGHWSALGLWQDNNVIGLDSGCLWGHSLSAVKLGSHPLLFSSVDCARYVNSKESPMPND